MILIDRQGAAIEVEGFCFGRRARAAVGESIGFALDGFLFSFSKAQDWIARSRSSPAGKLAVWCWKTSDTARERSRRGEVRMGGVLETGAHRDTTRAAAGPGRGAPARPGAAGAHASGYVGHVGLAASRVPRELEA